MNKLKMIPMFFSLVLLTSALASCGQSSDKFVYEGRALVGGKVGVEYSQSVAIDKKDVTYEIDYDSDLPVGLELTEDGIIHGIPELDGEYDFNIVAIKGRYFTTGNFTMTIEGGEITFTGSSLPNGKENQPYVRSIGNAEGSDKITYALKEGSELPEGLELSSNGEISGTPLKAVENASITIIASAQGCKDKEATFTLTIEKGQEVIENLGHIEFAGAKLEDGEVGSDYYQNLATAYGVPGITYKVKYLGGVGFPKGITFKNGILSGKAIDSTYGDLKFQVIASAEGYDSVTRDFSVNIKDKYVVTNQFEAEYMYVDNLVGAGYSGSNSGKNMIQTFQNASNTHVVGYLNTEITLTYNIVAEKDTKASLTMVLGTENGNMTLNQSTFLINVNGSNLEYTPIDVKEDGMSQDVKFHEYQVSPTIDLKAGDNVITFTVLKVGDGEGTSSARGPLFDKITLSNYEGEIGWRPKVANVK